MTGRIAAASERLFFAVWPPAAVQKEIVTYRETLPGLQGRRMADGNLHVTLVFLGQVNASQRAEIEMMAASLSAEPFTLMLDCCGYWPRSGVFWLAPAALPEALRGLQTALAAGAQRCGVKTDSRDYRPHLSLYRDVRRGPETLPPPAIRWPVSDFTLVRSDTDPAGVHYTVLRRWRLSG